MGGDRWLDLSSSFQTNFLLQNRIWSFLVCALLCDVLSAPFASLSRARPVTHRPLSVPSHHTVHLPAISAFCCSARTCFVFLLQKLRVIQLALFRYSQVLNSKFNQIPKTVKIQSFKMFLVFLGPIPPDPDRNRKSIPEKVNPLVMRKNSCTSGYGPILFIFCSVKGLCFCFQEQKTELALLVWFRFYNFLNIKNFKIFEKNFLTANRSQKKPKKYLGNG